MNKLKAIIILITLGLIVAALIVGSAAISARRRQERIKDLVASAEEKLAANDPQTALDLVKEVIERYGARNELDHLHYIQGRALEKQGKQDEALEQWKVIHDSYPDSPYAPEATMGLAMAQLEKGSGGAVDQAYELFRDVEQKYKDTPAYYDALFGFAKIALIDGKLLEAQESLQRLLDIAPEDYMRRDEVLDALGDLNLKILRSDLTVGKEQIYEIKKGDALERIGKKFGVNYELIMLVNRIEDPAKLRIGQKIKIPDISFSIVVDISDNTLTLLNHGQFFKRYHVRTGDVEGKTPLGKFRILDKEKNPAWDHDGRHYAPGDPGNELGTRWMAFSGRDIGIHGTNDASTIGKYASNGCVGMLTEDVEELYDLVLPNTPVEVVGKQKPLRRRGEEAASARSARGAASAPAAESSTSAPAAPGETAGEAAQPATDAGAAAPETTPAKKPNAKSKSTRKR
ncbi:MAG: L,D-transpeptidase family protein [Candidatus Sumerlaeota bacterium]|nr:L,D-transpeptidase family protein [Candidatus Sumerlaeota bacterium]